MMVYFVDFLYNVINSIECIVYLSVMYYLSNTALSIYVSVHIKL